jgi:hypothetical protein
MIYISSKSKECHPPSKTKGHRVVEALEIPPEYRLRSRADSGVVVNGGRVKGSFVYSCLETCRAVQHSGTNAETKSWSKDSASHSSAFWMNCWIQRAGEHSIWSDRITYASLSEHNQQEECNNRRQQCPWYGTCVTMSTAASGSFSAVLSTRSAERGHASITEITGLVFSFCDHFFKKWFRRNCNRILLRHYSFVDEK